MAAIFETPASCWRNRAPRLRLGGCRQFALLRRSHIFLPSSCLIRSGQKASSLCSQYALVRQSHIFLRCSCPIRSGQKASSVHRGFTKVKMTQGALNFYGGLCIFPNTFFECFGLAPCRFNNVPLQCVRKAPLRRDAEQTSYIMP